MHGNVLNPKEVYFLVTRVMSHWLETASSASMVKLISMSIKEIKKRICFIFSMALFNIYENNDSVSYVDNLFLYIYQL